ncbi:hypothetical protein V499_02288 [Pseudogymnoascus sp. VKM F-103]|nr:hypothetical protein V499_02288 [Pseudogymnoascus sp. VKM F-103]
MGLGLPQRTQTISEDAVSSKNIQAPPNDLYVQSKTDSQAPAVAFADAQPELPRANSEFGLFLQDRPLNFDFKETQGQPQLTWQFADFLQDRPLNFDFEETQGQPQLGYNELAFDFADAQVQHEYSSTPSIYSN